MFISPLFCKKKHFRNPVIFILLFGTAGIFSCSETNKQSAENKLPSNDSSVFYPVQEFFLTQLKSIEDSAKTITLITENDGQKDSSIITKEQLIELAQPFLENNISDPSVKKYYRESVFQDETTGTYTFDYSTVNNSLLLQNMQVLLDKTSQEVKRVFISQVKTNGDTFNVQKLGWKTGTGFFVNSSQQLNANKETVKQITVVWKYNN